MINWMVDQICIYIYK